MGVDALTLMQALWETLGEVSGLHHLEFCSMDQGWHILETGIPLLVEMSFPLFFLDARKLLLSLSRLTELPSLT